MAPEAWFSSPSIPFILSSSELVTRKCSMFCSSELYGSSSKALLATFTPFTYPSKDEPGAYGAKSLGIRISSWTTCTCDMYPGSQSKGISNVMESSVSEYSSSVTSS